MCSVFGPREVSKREDFSMTGAICVEFKFATFSETCRRGHQQDGQERDLSLLLQETLQPAILLHTFPKCQVKYIPVYLLQEVFLTTAAVIYVFRLIWSLCNVVDWLGLRLVSWREPVACRYISRYFLLSSQEFLFLLRSGWHFDHGIGERWLGSFHRHHGRFYRFSRRWRGNVRRGHWRCRPFLSTWGVGGESSANWENGINSLGYAKDSLLWFLLSLAVHFSPHLFLFFLLFRFSSDSNVSRYSLFIFVLS